ncbi:VOC family protein [Winogradskyella sp. PG-2]|uniref:VOC family protein n=1 Tax=Winogradskyella sp. PG-2 TaxID=754409 RepID=UPI0004586082|nr:VOC family protein [Winogradskyella sp. PG-2]BAO77232.1 glyoxalase family protein [Winogradskyella sp. PG-2]
MIKGLYETHLFVENLERSIDFYSNVLGLELCRKRDDRRTAFFWIGQPKQQMLGLWEKPKDEIDIRHFAFQCDPDWILNESVNFLKDKKLNFWNFLNDGTERPMVFAWMPAIAIYFSDPDGHDLEFIGLLEGESKPVKTILSYEEWKAQQETI